MQDQPTPERFRTAEGDYVVRSDDGERMGHVTPGEQPPTGWHFMTEAEYEDVLVERGAELAVAHSERFRKVSNRYPYMVAQAYGGDLARAAADTDEEVAAKVAAWGEAQGMTVRDWQEIGREERADDEPGGGDA